MTDDVTQQYTNLMEGVLLTMSPAERLEQVLTNIEQAMERLTEFAHNSGASHELVTQLTTASQMIAENKSDIVTTVMAETEVPPEEVIPPGEQKPVDPGYGVEAPPPETGQLPEFPPDDPKPEPHRGRRR